VELILEGKEVNFGTIFIDHFRVLNEVPAKINQNIKFVDIKTWKVYENYKINYKNIINQLGFFNNFFQYIPITTKSLENRRGDFQGYHMKVMTETEVPFTSAPVSGSIYDAKSETYDVTKTAGGFFIKEIFQEMQNWLNLSASLHKPKYGKWGHITLLDNGTIIADGAFGFVASGFAEMIIFPSPRLHQNHK